MFQADQLVSEKVSGAEHTKLDDNFVQMEKITDVFLEVEVSNSLSLELNISISNIYLNFRSLDTFKAPGCLFLIFSSFQGEMFEKTRDYLYPNPAVRVKQVSDKGIASIGVSALHLNIHLQNYFSLN